MTVAEIAGAIGEIRSRLALMAPRTGSDGGASFAVALSAASGTAATTAAIGATATGTGVTGDDVVAAARRYEGVPYVLGGESTSGIDCSGLVQAAFGDLGVDVPRLVHQQQTIGQEVGSLRDAQPGDLIVLDGGDHIAIWAGEGKAIHAPYPGRTVSEQKAWFDQSDVVTIRRVVPATADATALGVSSAGTALTGTALTGTALIGTALTGTALPGAASSGMSAAALAQATAMLGMYSGSSGTSSAADSLSAMLGSTTSGSSSTAQQLLAARAQLLGSAS